MQPNSECWHVVTDSEHAHEREGREHVHELLPDRGPFHAWSNFDFVDSNGTWSEVDLLVLGEGTLYLVELKHYQGDVGGNSAVELKQRLGREHGLDLPPPGGRGGRGSGEQATVRCKPLLYGGGQLSLGRFDRRRSDGRQATTRWCVT